MQTIRLFSFWTPPLSKPKAFSALIDEFKLESLHFSILLLGPMHRRSLPRRSIAFLRRMGFSQTHPRTTAVLVYEFDASGLKSSTL